MLTPLLVSLLAVSQVPPADAPAPDASAVLPVGATVSGGATLGTWEAGFMYLYSQAQKARPQFELRILTGASAGSANAVVAAIDSCRPLNPFPQRGPGWQVWVPIGFTDVFDRRRATDDGLFVRDALAAAFERVRAVWNEGLPESCDVVLGITVTRVKPREVTLKDGLTVPRVLETFLVRIQGRGLGRRPRLSNYQPPDSPLPVPLLPFVDDAGDVRASDANFSRLKGLVFASTAFPLAFPPQVIEYCLSKPPKPGQAATADALSCERPELADLFVDGGVFDNSPLRLAFRVSGTRLRRTADGRAVWAEPLGPAEGLPHPDVRHLYLDPETAAYPTGARTVVKPPDRGLLSKLSTLGGGIVESARARELMLLADEQGGIAGRVHLAKGQLPKASEHLSAFAGFFERDFRVFDFYLGMHDAFVGLASTPAWRRAPLDIGELATGDAQARAQWAPFLCMLAVAQPGYEQHLPECRRPELENFRVLLQVSIERLFDACRPSDSSLAFTAAAEHPLCARARQGFEAPVVPGLAALEPQVRRRADAEPDFDYFMRLLGEYRFYFKDLGLEPRQAGRGKVVLRERLEDVVDQWAQAQPSFADRLVARTGGRVALNAIEFSPPRYSGYAVLGTLLEAGGSAVPFWEPRWLQLTGALTLNYFFSLFTEKTPRFAVNLVAGPELRLTALSNTVVQPRLAVRAGVQLDVLDGFGTRACADVTLDARGCTQGVLEGLAAVTLLERLRMQLVWQTYPGLYGKTSSFFNLHFGVGFQFN